MTETQSTLVFMLLACNIFFAVRTAIKYKAMKRREQQLENYCLVTQMYVANLATYIHGTVPRLYSICDILIDEVKSSKPEQSHEIKRMVESVTTAKLNDELAMTVLEQSVADLVTHSPVDSSALVASGSCHAACRNNKRK